MPGKSYRACGAATMYKRILIALVALAAIFSVSPVRAQTLIESYTALLSARDHFNSNGVRLTSAAAIIRQDRANYYRFGLRDPEDEGDRYFADEANRATLERMLERGRAAPGVLRRIVDDAVLIRVDIYRVDDGDFIRVTVLN
jgi:hypothetical protein